MNATVTTPLVIAETTTDAANDVSVVLKLVRRDGQPPYVALAVADYDGDCMIAELDPVAARLLGADLSFLADAADR